jgi:N-acetylglucosaminyldiphosphoundecaprenol N-acetyl-beta-D-mannosaminyltransferase
VSVGLALPRHQVLGVEVQAIDIPTLFDLTHEAIRTSDKFIVANHNLHSIYLYHHDEKMRRYYHGARYIYVDGAPIVYLARVLGYPYEIRHRITSIDWIRPMLARGVGLGWRTFLLGGRPGVADKAADILTREVPGAMIATAHGFFDPTPGSREAEAVLEQIAHFRPHLLWLGMGMPRQEHWIADHFDRVQANVVFNLGGFMDLLTGDLPTPPRWVGRVNLEWLFRLATRPSRVWRRYLLEPWALAPLLAHDLSARVRRRGTSTDSSRAREEHS